MEAIIIVLGLVNLVILFTLILKANTNKQYTYFVEDLTKELAKRFEYQLKILSDRVTKLEDSDALRLAEARLDADIDRIVESLDVYTREISHLLKKRNWYQNLRYKNSQRLRTMAEQSRSNTEEYRAYLALNDEYDRILSKTKKEISEQEKLRGDHG